MNRYAFILCGLVLAAPLPARADHPGGATRSDVRMLQDDLANLDDTLATLDANDSRTAEFRRREQQIQDELGRLREDIQAHREDPDLGLSASKEAVDELRLRIRTLDEDVDRYSSRRFGTERPVQQGTRMEVRLEQSLSSRSARLEDRVEGAVNVPVRDASGRVAIPAGSRVVGTVTRVQRADRPLHGGELELVFDSVYVGNTRMDLRGRVVGFEDVNNDGRTAKRTGIGAALGGVLGGILGGTKGALIGIAIGGGGGFVSSKDDVDLPAGTVVTVELDRSLSARRY